MTRFPRKRRWINRWPVLSFALIGGAIGLSCCWIPRRRGLANASQRPLAHMSRASTSSSPLSLAFARRSAALQYPPEPEILGIEAVGFHVHGLSSASLLPLVPWQRQVCLRSLSLLLVISSLCCCNLQSC